MQNIPSGYASLQPTPAIPKKDRGVFLTVVLGFQTLAALWGTLITVIGGAKLDRFTDGGGSWQEIHHVTTHIVLAVAIFEIAKLASLMGMWAWKRWALLLYYAASALGLVAVWKLTGSLSYWEITAVVFMGIATLPRWLMFED